MGYIGVITHLLTIDPNFQRDIQVEDELKDFHFYTSKSHAVKFFKVPTWMDTNQAERLSSVR